MKKKGLIIALVLLMAGVFAPMADAVILNVEVGDRPYYSHGTGYWSGGRYWVWVPGHWSPHRHHWIHGHYRVRHHHY